MRRAMANAIELEILPDLNFLLPTILAIAKIAYNGRSARDRVEHD